MRLARWTYWLGVAVVLGCATNQPPPPITGNRARPEELARSPFIGARAFNFYGGTGTGYIVRVEPGGTTLVYAIGVCSVGVLYRGIYRDAIDIGDDLFVRFTTDEARLWTRESTGQRVPVRGCDAFREPDDECVSPLEVIDWDPDAMDPTVDRC